MKKIKEEDLVLGDNVAQGGQGWVMRAKYKGSGVAIKVRFGRVIILTSLHSQGVPYLDQSMLASFAHEIKILRQGKCANSFQNNTFFFFCSMLHHANIIEFVGVMIHKRNKSERLSLLEEAFYHNHPGTQLAHTVYLVTELMDYDLRHVRNVLTFDQKLAIARDIAKAV